MDGRAYLPAIPIIETDLWTKGKKMRRRRELEGCRGEVLAHSEKNNTVLFNP